MSKEAVFERLSALLRPYAGALSVKSDTDRNFYLEECRSTGKAQMFAAVQLKASYVALHVFPLYVHPELLDRLSPDLRSRMQGKSCFNFRKIEQVDEDDVRKLLNMAFDSLDS